MPFFYNLRAILLLSPHDETLYDRQAGEDNSPTSPDVTGYQKTIPTQNTDYFAVTPCRPCYFQTCLYPARRNDIHYIGVARLSDDEAVYHTARMLRLSDLFGICHKMYLVPERLLLTVTPVVQV